MTTSTTGRPGPRRPGSATGLSVIAVAIVAAILPVFLLGSLSVEIRAELGYRETTIGLMRVIRKTPAVTIVAAWIRAETGVGPSMASGSQK